MGGPPPRPMLVPPEVLELYPGVCVGPASKVPIADSFDVKKEASQLSKELPRDYKLLTAIVADPGTSIERRAKVLEVMIFRGATNNRTYNEMGDKDHRDYKKYRRQWEEHRLYQEAARDAIFLREPNLFNEISKSGDQLPQGRYPATEIMNTMLKNGGMYGDHDGRRKFENLLKVTDAETRGRMMAHLEEAGKQNDIHLKGEKRLTGLSGEFSAGNFGIGLGASWDRVADNHWHQAGDDVNGSIVKHLNENSADKLEEFKKGYTEARDRHKVFK